MTAPAKTLRVIARATASAGLLDIAAAATLAVQAGGKPAAMLRGIASGPFPSATERKLAGAALGLLVHFAIMAVVATVFVLAYQRSQAIRARPLAAGALYGILVWLVMYFVVLAERWPKLYPSTDPTTIGIQLFCNIALVGLPIAIVTRRG